MSTSLPRHAQTVGILLAIGVAALGGFFFARMRQGSPTHGGQELGLETQGQATGMVEPTQVLSNANGEPSAQPTLTQPASPAYVQGTNVGSVPISTQPPVNYQVQPPVAVPASNYPPAVNYPATPQGQAPVRASVPAERTQGNVAPVALVPAVGESAQLVQVLSGEMLILNINGRDTRVRLFGVVAPKAGSSDAREAQAALAQLLQSGALRVQYEPGRSDQSTLWVWSGNVLVNEVMVAKGWSLASKRDGNSRLYATRMVQAQSDAQRVQAGFWSPEGWMGDFH